MRIWRTYIPFALRGLVLFFSMALPIASADEPSEQDGGSVSAPGPDVIVSALPSSIIWHGFENTLTGYVTAYSIGTQSCNVGNVAILWQQLPSVQHPVIRSSMYRLKNNRFEQIGMSWVKHGFFAVNDPDCDLICTAPGNHGGTALYPGCSDPYYAYLNGDRSTLGPTLPINAHTGSFPSTVTHPSTVGQLGGRLQVHNVDLDPALNAGARYYMGAQYIAADDAAAGNGNNNASYQRASIVSATTFPEDSCSGNDPQRFCASMTEFVHVTESAIRAWKDLDPGVVETDAQVPGEGLFILAAKAIDLGTGFWRYEYALQNLNSDRSGKAFTIPVAIGASITNVGFHDVDYHSGEPIDGTDWEASVLSGKIIWSTQDYSENVNANALRWGTLYNFRFDTNAPPTSPDNPTTVVLDLFKPGAPDKININTVGPIVGFIDCNDNGVADACDVDCGGVGCSEPCGTSEDCNNNIVPDECETDCNENGIADTCDLWPQGESQDCNENTVPDECEEDCNHNGIPDNCETILDCDNDGVNDCIDLCPCSTPPYACEPPPFVCCRYAVGISIPYYGYFSCISNGATPYCSVNGDGSCDPEPPPCPVSFCRDGCLVGDGDGDGDFDLADYGSLARCYSGEQGTPAFVEPSMQCRRQFDYDENSAIDLADVEQFQRELAGPGDP